MKNYRLIGLTGPTGAGKSEVARFFRESGYEVICADFLAREIMNNPLVIQSLKANFGDDIIMNNKLNRGLLAERAFKSSDTKKLLDSITHPFIALELFDELKRLSKTGAQRILFDASQLFESGADVICDCVISVTAPKEVRLNRIKERDGLTDEQADERISVQLADEYFRDNCDFVIENTDDLKTLKRAVNKTIKALEVRFGSD